MSNCINTLQGSTALHLSSSNGQMEVVTVLLDKTADPNVKDKDVCNKLRRLCRVMFLKKKYSLYKEKENEIHIYRNL